MISLDHISVRLPANKTPSREILHDIAIDIQRGEWIALAGANGAGKTTLLHAVAGVVPPSEGSIRYAAGDAPRTALVLQEPDNQFVASTVEDELKLSVPGTSDADRAAIAEAVDRFLLAGFLERNPHRLSGGEKQRLALATAWLAQPQLLLLDEPTAFLDDVQRARCIDFARQLNERGATVLWATPDGDCVEHASRILEIEDGRVGYDGAADGFQWAAPVAVVERPSRVEREERRALARVEGVSFGYDGGNKILDGVSFVVQEGDCIGIEGANGSGKTTLLALLSGVLQPRRGAIERDFNAIVEGGRQQVFPLVQNAERLFFAETVMEELSFGLTKLGVTGDDSRARVGAALTRVGLTPSDFLSRSPFTLSLGEMRRLSFALAITLEPRLLLMDEPTAGLDAAGKALFAELADSLTAAGAAIVVASHDSDMLSRVCSRTVAL